MGIFGWSLPPGCGTLPGEEEYPCEVCGGMPEDDCICEECSVCGGVGDPYCYEQGHMEKTQEQIEQLARKEKEWEDDNRWEPLPDVEELSDEDVL